MDVDNVDTEVGSLDILVPEVDLVEDPEAGHLSYHVEVPENNPGSSHHNTSKRKNATKIVKKRKAKIKSNLDGSSLNKISLNTCQYCDRIFNSEQNLSTHLSKKHNPFKPYNCEFCNSSYPSREYLIQHCIIHKGQLYKCSVCRKKFATTELRAEHARTHIKKIMKKKHQCEICEKKFIHKVSLRMHVLMHTTGLVFPCNVCKKEFKKSNSLAMHMMVHERKYACDICELKFTTKAKLDKHSRSHFPGPLRYICHICSHTFPSKYHMDKHIAAHKKEGLDTSYDTSSTLEASSLHESTSNSPESEDNVAKVIKGKEKYKCHACNQVLLTAEALEDHKKIHLESKHVCDICKKVFKNTYNLKLHTRIHTGEKPYECNICKKKFVTSSKVVRHMKMHTGQRDHKCVTCNRSFMARHHLRDHMKLHKDQVKVD